MNEASSLHRIEAALARIDDAAAARRADRESLVRRHAALRTAMTEAIAMLDAIAADEDR